MDIIKKFEEAAIKHSNMLLFTSVQTLEIIEDCRKMGTRIYGIDGFKISGKWIQPIGEHSVDFSYIQNEHALYDMAKTFVEERMNLELVFEIVI